MVFNKLHRIMSPVYPYGRGLLVLLHVLITLTTTNQTTTEDPMTTVSPHNQVRIEEVKCSGNNMTVNLLFSNPFRGRIYTMDFQNIDGCGYNVPEPYSVNRATLVLKHDTCGSHLSERSSGIRVRNRVKVQFHRTIPSQFDTTLTTTCTIPETAGIRDTRLDVVLGSELNPESFNGSDFDASAFYLKITAAKKFADTDIDVRYCNAHKKRKLDNKIFVCQLNDFYGCNESKILDEDFPIMDEGQYVVKVLKFKDPAILTSKPLFITCGVNVCEDLCKRQCDLQPLLRPNTFNHFASKTIYLNRSTIANIPLPQKGQNIYSNCLNAE